MAERETDADALDAVASADDVDDMLNVADESDLDSMLAAEESEEVASIDEPSAFDLDMMLADPESSDSLPSLEDIAFGEEAPEKVIPKQKKEWFANIFNQELGPFDFDALHKMVHAGELSKSDQVRLSSEKAWSPANSLVGLFDGVEEKVVSTTQSATGNISPQRQVTPLKAKKPRKQVSQPEPVAQEGEAIWYCLFEGQETGPMTFEKLRKIGEEGKLSEDDKVRFEGSGGWVPANSIGGLMTTVVEVPSPAPVLTSERQEAPVPRPDSPPPPMEAATPPRPAYTPPAYTPPPAPRKFTPPPKAKSASSMRNPLENLKFDPKVAGIVGGIVLLGLIYYFMPSFAGMGDKKYYEETVAMYEKCVKADGNMTAVKAELEPRMLELKEELEQIASSRRPLLRTLLDCYRYYFPKVLDGTEEERAAALKGLEERLKQAKTYL